MNEFSAKLGIIMSRIAITAFVVYTFCFIAILFVNKPFTWTNINEFALYEEKSHSIYKYIGMACMIIFSCAFVVITLCVGDGAVTGKAVLSKASSLFALAFCVMIGINYFVQITATRLQLKSGLTEGLTQFTQSFNISAINAMNMLGWTVFYALSTLCLAFLFDKSSPGMVAGIFCIANTVMMFIGLIGYVLNNSLILAISMNLGLGATSLGIIIPLIPCFKRLM